MFNGRLVYRWIQMIRLEIGRFYTREVSCSSATGNGNCTTFLAFYTFRGGGVVTVVLIWERECCTSLYIIHLLIIQNGNTYGALIGYIHTQQVRHTIWLVRAWVNEMAWFHSEEPTPPQKKTPPTTHTLACLERERLRWLLIWCMGTLNCWPSRSPDHQNSA